MKDINYYSSSASSTLEFIYDSRDSIGNLKAKLLAFELACIISGIEFDYEEIRKAFDDDKFGFKPVEGKKYTRRDLSDIKERDKKRKLKAIEITEKIIKEYFEKEAFENELLEQMKELKEIYDSFNGDFHSYNDGITKIINQCNSAEIEKSKAKCAATMVYFCHDKYIKENILQLNKDTFNIKKLEIYDFIDRNTIK